MEKPLDPLGDREVAGDATPYEERLWPSLGAWLMVPLMGVAVLVTLLPVGVTPAVVCAVAAAAGLLAWGVMSTPVVAVRDGELVAGRAHVPVELLGDVLIARGEQARHERGPGLDARAYLLLRGWVDPVLRVELRDRADPTPYWLISTRGPERLARALDEARTSR